MRMAEPASRLRGKAGIGLRAPHLVALIEAPPPGLAWVEVHAENYMATAARACASSSWFASAMPSRCTVWACRWARPRRPIPRTSPA
jgi:hypothetical protein